jgi:type II secretory pathway component PulF
LAPTGVILLVETLAIPAPPAASPSRSFALFGSLLVSSAYAANLVFWWRILPSLEQMMTPMGRAPALLQIFFAWSHFVNHFAILILPLYVGLVIIHVRALFSLSRRRRTLAWWGMMLVGLALVGQIIIMAPFLVGSVADWGMTTTSTQHH